MNLEPETEKQTLLGSNCRPETEKQIVLGLKFRPGTKKNEPFLFLFLFSYDLCIYFNFFGLQLIYIIKLQMTSLSEIYMRHAKPIQEESTKRNKRNSAETSEAAPPSNKKTNSKLAKSSIAKKEQKGNVVTKKSPTEGIAESHQQTLVDAVSNRKYSLRAKNNVPPHRLLVKSIQKII